MQALTEDELRRVLTEPRNALVRQYHVTFAQSRAAFHVTRGALRAIAGIARDRGTGARGLRSILEELLRDGMFEVWQQHVVFSARCLQAMMAHMCGRSI